MLPSQFLEKEMLYLKWSDFIDVRVPDSTAFDKYREELMKTKLLSDNNNPITVFWKNTLKKNIEDHFLIQWCASTLKLVDAICAKIHSDIRLSNVASSLLHLTCFSQNLKIT